MSHCSAPGNFRLHRHFTSSGCNSISPCPLATNITAIAYISMRIDSSRHTLLTGFVYTLGRMAAYIAVASVIVFFGMNIQIVALGLQHYGERLLGPFLLLCGIYLLDIVHFDRLPGGDWFSGFTSGISARLAEKGYLGAFLLRGDLRYELLSVLSCALLCNADSARHWCW